MDRPPHLRPAHPGGRHRARQPRLQNRAITPHLGSLTRLQATYPHPLGLIRVHYEGGKGEISLPAGLTGVFVWKGKETVLASGENRVELR